MVGNDVVDLGDPETAADAAHPRFDERVFSADEREQMVLSDDPLRMRWILWAAKESAYKAARRVDPKTVFSPSCFHVRLDDQLHGTVVVSHYSFEVRVDVHGDCIHAVASEKVRDSRELAYGLGRSGDSDPSARVRSLAIGSLAERLGVRGSDLSVRRIARLPQLCVDGQPTDHALSLSHHGRFVAWACMVEPKATEDLIVPSAGAEH
jgi:phosphopantetheinyl transferase (holo-ACP synthase)